MNIERGDATAAGRTGRPGLSSVPPACEPLPRLLWLYLPVSVAVLIAVAQTVAPEWTWEYLFIEGGGVIELLHFFIPLAAAILAVRGWWRLPRGAGRGLSAMLLLLAVGSVYIAGEEQSWGQHFFHWQTPQGWGEVNRQNETNLHNASSWLNHKPRVLLNIAIIAATVLVPLMRWRGLGAGLLDRLRFVLPGVETRAVGLLVLVYMVWDSLAKDGFLPKIASREAEMHELFIYGFLLIYAHEMFRRIGAWRRLHVDGAPGPGPGPGPAIDPSA